MALIHSQPKNKCFNTEISDDYGAIITIFRLPSYIETRRSNDRAQPVMEPKIRCKHYYERLVSMQLRSLEIVDNTIVVTNFSIDVVRSFRQWKGLTIVYVFYIEQASGAVHNHYT